MYLSTCLCICSSACLQSSRCFYFIFFYLFIILVVIRSLEDGALSDNELESLTNDKLTEETVRVLFAGLRSLLTSAIRQPNLKSEVV